MPNGDHDSSVFTIKELVLQVGQDVKALDAKVDGVDSRITAFIQAHETRHAADAQMAAQIMADPSLTIAGRNVTAKLDDHEARLKALEQTETRDAIVASIRSAHGLDFRWKIGIAIAAGGSIASAIAALHTAHVI